MLLPLYEEEYELENLGFVEEEKIEGKSWENEMWRKQK